MKLNGLGVYRPHRWFSPEFSPMVISVPRTSAKRGTSGSTYCTIHAGSYMTDHHEVFRTEKKVFS